MIIYRLSIVKRNYPVGHPKAMITEFVEDFEFKQLNRLHAKRDRLLNQGITKDQLDITKHEKLNGEYDLV